MCLYVDDFKRKKAKKDIKVLKVLFVTTDITNIENRVYESPIHKTLWKLGQTRTIAKSEEGHRNGFIVKKGYYHSYKADDKMERWVNALNPIFNRLVFEATIPKGTWYYEGFQNDSFFRGYASKSLRIDKLLDCEHNRRYMEHFKRIKRIEVMKDKDYRVLFGPK